MDLSENQVSADYFKHKWGSSLDQFLEVVKRLIIEIKRNAKPTDYSETKEARHNEIKETNDNKNSSAVLMDKEEALKILRMVADGKNPFEGEKPAKYLPEHNPKTIKALCRIIASLFPSETEGDVISTRQPLILGKYLNKPIEQFFKNLESDAISEALTKCLLKENKAAKMLGIPYSELQRKIVENNIDLSTMETKAIIQALSDAEWDKEKAAGLLDITLNKLDHKIDEHSIGPKIVIEALLAAVKAEYKRGLRQFSLDQMLARIEKNANIKALEKSDYKKNKAAEKLKISFRSLRYRIDKLRLEESDTVDPTIEIDYFKFCTDLSLDEFLKIVEKKFIELALKEKANNQNRAAEKLGISFRSLRYRVEQLGINSEKI